MWRSPVVALVLVSSAADFKQKLERTEFIWEVQECQRWSRDMAWRREEKAADQCALWSNMWQPELHSTGKLRGGVYNTAQNYSIQEAGGYGILHPPWATLVAQRWRICLQCWRCGFDPWVGKIPWRRKWQSTPALLPGKSHGQMSLVGYSPWCSIESDWIWCLNDQNITKN